MSSSQLNYAEKLPLHHRRPPLKYLAGGLMFLFVSSCAWWLPAALRRFELLYWQRQCLAYLAPADELVYDHSRSVQLVPEQWSHFYSVFSPPGFQSEATVFMHELKKQNGDSRLVILDFVPNSRGNLMQFPRVFAPGTPGKLPKEISQRSDQPMVQFPEADTLLFSGHVDPANQNHFTFRVQQAKNHMLFDGWLQSDDTVIIGEDKLLVSGNPQP